MRNLLAAFRPLRYAIVGALFVGLAFAAGAKADDATVTWTHPTQYVDNSPIPAGGISATEIQYGKCNATRTGLLATPAPVTVSVPFPTTTRTITGLTTAEWCFAARSLQPVGSPSDWTAQVWKLIDIKPKPPVLSSTITIAYETWTFGGKVYLGRSIGTAPIGTECQAAIVQSFGVTYYQIPATAVTLTPGRTPRPGPLVTKCA
jgi:hypothetical protein